MSDRLPVDEPFVDPFADFVAEARRGDTTQRVEDCSKHGEFAAHRSKWGYGFSPWSTCPICSAERKAIEDARDLERKAEEELQQRRMMVIESGLVGRLRDATFEAFAPGTVAQHAALETCEAFARNVERDSGAGLILMGKCGTGKTHLAAAIALHVMQQRGRSALFSGARDLIREIRSTWRRDADCSESDVITKYRRATVLVIDDIGTGSSTEAEQLTLLDVIDARYRYRAPIVVTTNLDAPSLRSAVGPRCFDRLQEGAQTIVFNWSSHRRPA